MDPCFKSRTNLAVHGSQYPFLKIRTKMAVHGSLLHGLWTMDPWANFILTIYISGEKRTEK